ncbi:uncharacterized mitochondrial protein AtMg00860-like [Hibiscus syriacus]|uniref:uncharacterized mitochondrial protein AtMg00860-like n=1 Tax=Hibiscus syriacus TaxID=106335 RepID=UPI0019233E89|nr:uncharacterized mitochondrial protein AtMg00860-like [Hibiscus syriacus]
MKNKYPIPLTVDLFNQLGGVRCFTKLDLQSEYYQFRIAECDDPNTACVTRYVYLDDIVVYSKTFEEHVEHLKRVFQILRENELYVKEEKCSFSQKEVSFIGHIIGGGKLQVDWNKIRAIDKWKPPTKATELRALLELANYYRRFVKGYSKIATPLTELLKKEKL